MAACALPVRSALTGQSLCELDVPAMARVGDLKGAIELSTGVPRQEQLLLALGRPLADEDHIGPGIVLRQDPHLSLLRRPPAEAARLESQRVALKHIAADGRLSTLNLESRDDPQVVLAAVVQCVTNLKDASERFRRDPEEMLAAVQINLVSHCYAHGDLWCNRDFALGAVKVNGDLLKYVDPQFQDDSEIVLAALEQDGHLLKHASFACRGLREVVLAAVRQKGTSLCYVADLLKHDREIVLTAVQQDGMAFCHVGPDLKRDPEVRAATRYRDGRPIFKEKAVDAEEEERLFWLHEERLDVLERSMGVN